MRDFDATIKLLIQKSANELLRQLGIAPVTEWLNVELPRLRNSRADLVGRTAAGTIIHIELQSENDPEMAIRMAEYALDILRRYKQYPEQLVLFVGNGKLTMKPVLKTGRMTFSYDQLDIRQLDGEKLMRSAQISGNVLAVLAGLKDSAGSIRQVLRKIVKLKKGRRSEALTLLFSTAELRSLEDTVREEVEKLPVTVKTSINNKTFGPWIRKGMAKGIEKGMQKGLVRAVRLTIRQRFGAVPIKISRRLDRMSEHNLEQILAGLLAAKTLDELFPSAGER